MYLTLNEDLINVLVTEELAISHYINYGYYEKRRYNMKLPDEFDCLTYRLLNEDINYMNDNELVIHYYKYGYLENRKYKMELPDDFNYDLYILLNEDISHLSEDDAKIHYLKYDYNKLVVPNNNINYNEYNNFDWNAYLDDNQDLKMNDKLSAFHHWQIYGKLEGRVNNIYLMDDYDNFDYNFYIRYNNDIYDVIDKDSAFHHWVMYGKVNGRISNLNCKENILGTLDNFDWEFYIDNNCKLKYISNKIQAFNHWNIVGCVNNYCSRIIFKKGVMPYIYININNLKINNKDDWRLFCNKNLKYLYLYDLPKNISLDSNNNAVFIEFRDL
jgi:hypothetical protein